VLPIGIKEFSRKCERLLAEIMRPIHVTKGGYPSKAPARGATTPSNDLIPLPKPKNASRKRINFRRAD
jgi:hypothetical protein